MSLIVCTRKSLIKWVYIIFFVSISSNDLKEYPQAVQSIKEASQLLAEAIEHKNWSGLFKNLATLQLERAHNEVKHAESQLEAAEEYMCTIMHVIHSSGFTINFVDTHAPAMAVMKVDNSELYIVLPVYTLYSIYLL